MTRHQLLAPLRQVQEGTCVGEIPEAQSQSSGLQQQLKYIASEAAGQAYRLACSPPSLKLSGVTFKIPISRVVDPTVWNTSGRSGHSCCILLDSSS